MRWLAKLMGMPIPPRRSDTYVWKNVDTGNPSGRWILVDPATDQVLGTVWKGSGVWHCHTYARNSEWESKEAAMKQAEYMVS